MSKSEVIDKQKVRLAAWRQDDKFIAAEHLNIPGRWKVVGNQTWFVYLDELTKEKAVAYAAELNQNKEWENYYKSGS